MDLETANESDIREEYATPLLKKLGYERGTSNDIARERQLRYNFHSVGRKKPSDQVVRGIPDYVLSVTGAGRWVLEVKGPQGSIGVNEIEQTLTYCRHPEISASYAALVDGREFLVFKTNQIATDEPILRIEIENIEQLYQLTRSILSPASIRRDCTPNKVSVGRPLSEGFRSDEEVGTGFIKHVDGYWEANFDVPEEVVPQIETSLRLMQEIKSTIIGGKIQRDENSRIVAQLKWALPFEGVETLAIDKGMMEVEYISLSEEISQDEENPTTFDVFGSFEIYEGESIYDVANWTSVVAELPVDVFFRGQAIGYLDGNRFVGIFSSIYSYKFLIPNTDMVLEYGLQGVFEVQVRT